MSSKGQRAKGREQGAGSMEHETPIVESDASNVVPARKRVDREAEIELHLDRVIEILDALEALRRYGGDGEALIEAKDCLQRIKKAL